MSGGIALSPRDVAEQLGDRSYSLVPKLLPGGIYAQGRRAWRVGSLAGEPGGALRVYLDGPRRGRWRDYKSGQAGDLLDLVAAVACHGDTRAAYRWACDWLGVGRIEPAEAERLRHRAEQAREVRRQEAEREAEGHARAAKGLWLAAAPLQPGDAGWRYLADRGINLGMLPAPPAALRLHLGLWNPESQRHWPALVAAICGADGRHVNTHRIWLDPQSNGQVKKAPLAQPKLSMPGGYPGGAVRLWRGKSGRPWNAMPDGETVLAGEGIEDLLTIVSRRPEWRAVAVLSVSSLAPLVLPPAVARLIWIAQNDPPRSPAAKALAAALALHRAAGRRVSVIRPPRLLKDVNDYAQALASHTIPHPAFGEAA